MKQEKYPSELWKKGTETITDDKAKKFVEIIRYALTMLHCNTVTTCTDTFTYEQTSFVNYSIPSFQVLSKVTLLIKFHWCEKELSTRMFYLKEADCDQLKISVKNIEVLGISNAQGLDEEQIMIESSTYVVLNAVKF
ncbi:hypothetical protein K501DRAFT_274562 [Backusella circina FSU 941]|nr:hypothetical protein K501DRAFT_274562 [Backusella circina FSU 941]